MRVIPGCSGFDGFAHSAFGHLEKKIPGPEGTGTVQEGGRSGGQRKNGKDDDRTSHKQKTPQSAAPWYWVGESNSYCEIENLEY